MTDKSRPDRRVLKTKSSLWEALFHLLQERDWQEINVSAICQKANVARSSFYLHFENKQELLDYGFETGINELRSTVLVQQDANFFGTLDWLVDHVIENSSFFKRSKDTNSPVMQKFQRAAKALFQEELERKPYKAEAGTAAYIAGGTFEVLVEWVSSDQKITRKALSDLVQRNARLLLNP